MHIKKSDNTKKQLESQVRMKIIELYLEGKGQTEIMKSLTKQFSEKVNSKKLKIMVFESEYMSPKNLRLGAFLLFALTLITPPATVYLRGYEYHTLVYPMLTLSLVFSAPFLIFGVLMQLSKSLNRIVTLSLYMLGYIVVYLITYFFISLDIRIWTLIMFPLILLPTLISEHIKLMNLKKFVEKNRNLNTKQ
jgi:hypothetical protein